MKEVGIRELKNRLSEFIRLVRAGEVVVITDRGEIVAELRPPSVGGDLVEKYPILGDMARRGLIRLPLVAKRPGIYRRLPAVTPPGTAQRLLDEDRGER